MSTPKLSLDEALACIVDHSALYPGGPDAWPVKHIAWRGYFLDSKGKPGVNDRDIYDDAHILVTPTLFATFNGNVDPSIYRDKVASLEPNQFIKYKIGWHRRGTPTGHQALIQSSPVIVRRDGFVKPSGKLDVDWGISLGNGLWTDRNWPGGYFMTNLHRGGTNTTSSLGCLTVPPSQWTDFFSTVKRQLSLHSTSLATIVVSDPRIS